MTTPSFSDDGISTFDVLFSLCCPIVAAFLRRTFLGRLTGVRMSFLDSVELAIVPAEGGCIERAVFEEPVEGGYGVAGNE